MIQNKNKGENMGSINKDERKNNTIVITLIFFLIFLLISSIIIFSRFSINSKRVGTNLDKSTTDIKISKIEEEKSKEKEIVQPSNQKQEAQPQTQQPQVVQKPTVQQQPQQQLQQKSTTVQPSPQTKPQQAKSKPTTSYKETKPANYVINAKNIKKYHNVLLKEFENVTIVDYKVKWGDTLWKIALKYNTSAHSIYVYNAFNDPDLIIAGSIIKVPTNFVLSKTRTNTILLDLISKEKSGYNNSSYNNFALFKDLNSDNVLSNNYIIDNFVNLIYIKDDYNIIIKDIILRQI